MMMMMLKIMESREQPGHRRRAGSSWDIDAEQGASGTSTQESSLKNQRNSQYTYMNQQHHGEHRVAGV
ncbi:unnamed protein product, partial [Brenthis ino]